jgi:hypothetical protein
MKQQTPTETPISAGVVITTAEAVTTRNLIIGLLAGDLKEIHSDPSQLPIRLPQVW